MPHLVLEYSDNIAAQVSESNLLHHAHAALMETGVFAPADLKSRLHGANAALVGTKGTDGSFVHGWIYLLEGRTPEQKSLLTDTLFSVLNTHADFADQRSVDIRDMARDTYRK